MMNQSGKILSIWILWSIIYTIYRLFLYCIVICHIFLPKRDCSAKTLINKCDKNTAVTIMILPSIILLYVADCYRQYNICFRNSISCLFCCPYSDSKTEETTFQYILGNSRYSLYEHRNSRCHYRIFRNRVSLLFIHGIFGLYLHRNCNYIFYSINVSTKLQDSWPGLYHSPWGFLPIRWIWCTDKSCIWILEIASVIGNHMHWRSDTFRVRMRSCQRL